MCTIPAVYVGHLGLLDTYTPLLFDGALLYLGHTMLAFSTWHSV